MIIAELAHRNLPPTVLELTEAHHRALKPAARHMAVLRAIKLAERFVETKVTSAVARELKLS